MSSSQADWVRDHPVFEKMEVIPNFLPTPFLRHLRDPPGSWPDSVAFVGALTEAKGLQHLVAAWPDVRARVPTASLHVFGSSALYDRSSRPGDIGVADPDFEHRWNARLGTSRRALQAAGVRFYGLEDNKRYFGTADKPGDLYSVVQRAVDLWIETKQIPKKVDPKDVIGKLDAAVFGSPHMTDEKTVVIGSGKNRTLANLEQNPFAVYLIMEPGTSIMDWKGIRVYLKVKNLATSGPVLDTFKKNMAKVAGEQAAAMIHAVVSFEITEIRPLIDMGQGWEKSI